jgi:hypothetical protein
MVITDDAKLYRELMTMIKRLESAISQCKRVASNTFDKSSWLYISSLLKYGLSFPLDILYVEDLEPMIRACELYFSLISLILEKQALFHRSTLTSSKFAKSLHVSDQRVFAMKTIIGGNSLEVKFKSVIEFAERGRSSGNWDGLKMWTECKAKFSDDSTGEWTGPILNKLYSSVRDRILLELPEHNTDGDMNEPNHFIIQCLRIPFKNKFTERRLMQVAYNIGQFRASAAEYDQKYIDEFYALKLDQMKTYAC